MSTIEQTPTARAAPVALPDDEILVSVMMPCLNEEANIERCVRLAREVMEREGIGRRGRGQRLRGSQGRPRCGSWRPGGPRAEPRLRQRLPRRDALASLRRVQALELPRRLAPPALPLGTPVLALGLCANACGTSFMGEKDTWLDRMNARFRLEDGLLLGGALRRLLGFVIAAVIVVLWIHRGFGALSDEKLAVLATSLMVVGIQVFFSSFLLSILGLRR